MPRKESTATSSPLVHHAGFPVSQAPATDLLFPPLARPVSSLESNTIETGFAMKHQFHRRGRCRQYEKVRGDTARVREFLRRVKPVREGRRVARSASGCLWRSVRLLRPPFGPVSTNISKQRVMRMKSSSEHWQLSTHCREPFRDAIRVNTSHSTPDSNWNPLMMTHHVGHQNLHLSERVHENHPLTASSQRPHCHCHRR
jgi:hypothetical protein